MMPAEELWLGLRDVPEAHLAAFGNEPWDS